MWAVEARRRLRRRPVWGRQRSGRLAPTRLNARHYHNIRTINTNECYRRLVWWRRIPRVKQPRRAAVDMSVAVGDIRSRRVTPRSETKGHEGPVTSPQPCSLPGLVWTTVLGQAVVSVCEDGGCCGDNIWSRSEDMKRAEQRGRLPANRGNERLRGQHGGASFSAGAVGRFQQGQGGPCAATHRTTD